MMTGIWVKLTKLPFFLQWLICKCDWRPFNIVRTKLTKSYRASMNHLNILQVNSFIKESGKVMPLNCRHSSSLTPVMIWFSVYFQYLKNQKTPPTVVFSQRLFLVYLMLNLVIMADTWWLETIYLLKSGI